MVKMKAANIGYRNFRVAVYCRVYDVQKMGDMKWLEQSFTAIQRYLTVNKIYLETYRDMILADKESVQKIKAFFEKRGVKTSGAIAPTSTERQLQTLCYTKPEHRQKTKDIIQFTAELFDEIILDDWFFTNCKCEACIKAKGSRSWTDFRLELMKDVAEKLVIEPARSINPDVNLIIKYPNWYEYYQFLGYNLDIESKLFDMIYTGTETRDPEYTTQHLQQYQSYSIMRYLENVKPGKNGGGWIDPYGRRYLDRFAEQVRLTLLAKVKEITLFCYADLVESVKQSDGSEKTIGNIAPVLENVFEEADSFFDKLGEPCGIPSYKPYNSSGEDFLHNYIGMLGVPIEMVPEFPYESSTIFLAESAKYDKEIVNKIRGQLIKGKTVIITSGLLKALQDKGIEDIVEIKYTGRKALVNKFMHFMDVYQSDKDILVPQIQSATNDVLDPITCLDEATGYPFLLQVRYGQGALFVLTIPDNFSDLYHLPQETLSSLKRFLMRDYKVYVESPAKICLFTYDNDAFVVESFLPHMVRCNIVVNKKQAKLNDLLSTREWFFGREPSSIARGEQTVFPTFTFPNSYRVYRFE